MNGMEGMDGSDGWMEWKMDGMGMEWTWNGQWNDPERDKDTYTAPRECTTAFRDG